MTGYSEFFLSSPRSVAELETIEISHPNFSQTYRVVRNHSLGVTVTLEDTTTADFQYYPMQVTAGKLDDNLDQALTLDFGDLGEVIPSEIDLVFSADGFYIRPTLIYRTYRSDDLTHLLSGPINYAVNSVAIGETGATITAVAPSLTASGTGIVYTLDLFPMLRGFL